MRWIASVVLILAVAVPSGFVRASGEDVPLYTNADLDRMFGKSPSTPARIAAPSTADEDWRRVEAFLDREHARLDADRRYELERRAYVEVPRPEDRYYDGYAAWGLGYPASTWWNNVWGTYARATSGHSVDCRPSTVNRRLSTVNRRLSTVNRSRGPRVHSQQPSVNRARR